MVSAAALRSAKTAKPFKKPGLNLPIGPEENVFDHFHPVCALANNNTVLLFDIELFEVIRYRYHLTFDI